MDSDRFAPPPVSPGLVVVAEAARDGLAQILLDGRHEFSADEPVESGGADQGPNPYELLLMALGACTSMTLRLFARRRDWPLERTIVRLLPFPNSRSRLRQMRGHIQPAGSHWSRDRVGWCTVGPAARTAEDDRGKMPSASNPVVSDLDSDNFGGATRIGSGRTTGRSARRDLSCERSDGRQFQALGAGIGGNEPVSAAEVKRSFPVSAQISANLRDCVDGCFTATRAFTCNRLIELPLLLRKGWGSNGKGPRRGQKNRKQYGRSGR